MSDKKYYWLKLKEDFFKRHDIQIIENMPHGKDILIFYLKLLCESLDHDGCLRFSDKVPYTEKMLSTITCTDEEITKKAIETLCELQMMQVLDDGTILMTKMHDMTGSETYWAGQKRKQRQSEDNVQSMSKNVQDMSTSSPRCPSKRIENRDKRIDKKIYGANQNVLLADDEIQKLKEQFPDYLTKIDDLSFYLASTGKKYKSHYMTILSWARKEAKGGKVVKTNQFTQGVLHHDIDFDALEKKLVKN